MYSSELGRFTQPDTIIPGAGNPQAWNRYSYTLNNPVKYTDPSGHMHLKDGDQGYCKTNYCKLIKAKSISKGVSETKKLPFRYTHHLSIGFIIGTHAINIPDQSSDDFLSDADTCSIPQAAPVCAIALTERFAIMGSRSKESNFWVDLDIDYSEQFGTTLNNVNLYNYSAGEVIVQSIRIKNGLDEYLLQGPLSIRRGFGGQVGINIPVTFDKESSIDISIELKQQINIGSAVHPGPMTIYPDYSFSLPSYYAVQTFINSGKIPFVTGVIP